MSGWITYGDGAPREIVLTEDELARRFAEREAGRLRYCHDAGAWFVWDGAVWRRDRTGIAPRRARELARESVGEETSLRSGGPRFAAGIERFARGEPALAVSAADWDADPFLLSTPGGTVDLATGAMRAADPGDGISRATAVAPTETPDCPLWRRFLDETTGGDAETVRFLQNFFGYALTGAVNEQVVLFGHGSGGNGKTVLMNTVAGIFGDYAVTAALDTFAAAGTGAGEGARVDRHSADLAMLHGARLVTVAETGEGRGWAEARIKLLTGGDRVTARFLRRDFFTFAPTFKLFIVGNHKPRLRTIDEAMRRRFCLVPFTARPGRPDRDLEAKLREEWPAILRWMIEGCLDWRANGLVRPRRVREATADYFSAEDVVGQFLGEACEMGDAAATVPAGALYAAWTAWARDAGEAAGSQRAFADALEQRGLTRDRTRSARLYRGLRLKAACDA